MEVLDIKKCNYKLMTADGEQFHPDEVTIINPIYLVEDWHQLGITINGKTTPIVHGIKSQRFVVVPLDVIAEGQPGNNVVLTLCVLPSCKGTPRPLSIKERKEVLFLEENYQKLMALPYRDIRHVKQLIILVQNSLDRIGISKPFVKRSDDEIRKSDLYRIMRKGDDKGVLTCMLSDAQITDEQIMPDVVFADVADQFNTSRRPVPGSQPSSPVKMVDAPIAPTQPLAPRNGETPPPISELDQLVSQLREVGEVGEQIAEVLMPREPAARTEINIIEHRVLSPIDELMEDVQTEDRRVGLLTPIATTESIMVTRRDFDIPDYGKMMLYDPDLSDIHPDQRVDKFVMFNMEQMPDVDEDTILRIYVAGESRYKTQLVQPADSPTVVSQTETMDWNADTQPASAEDRSQLLLENVRKRRGDRHPDIPAGSSTYDDITNRPISEHRWTQSQRYPKGCIAKRPRLNPAEHPLAVSRDVKMGKHSLTARRIFDITGSPIPATMACNAIVYTTAIIKSNCDYVCSTPARIEFGCLLTNGWSTPNERIQSHVSDSVLRFHRVSRSPEINDLTRIIWTASKCVATYTPPQLEAMKINAHAVRVRDLTQTMQNFATVSRDFVEPIADMIIAPSYLYDNSGLYLHLMTLYSYLHDVAANKCTIMPQDPPPAEVLDTVCISLNRNDARLAALKLRQAAQDGRCVLDASSFTSKEQSVMRLLANGIESIPHNRQVLKTTQQFFKFDKVYFTLYHNRLNADGTAADVLHPNEAVTADDVYQFAFHLAEVMNDLSSLYRGVIAFCSIMHGQCVGQGCGRGQKGKIRYMTNMYELGDMHFPAPKFPNPFHRMLGWCADADTQQHIAGEIVVLRDMEAHYFRMVCASIGVMLSISAGTLLHSYNLTGRDMNHNIRLIANSASRKFCELMCKPGRTGRSVMYDAVTGVLNAFGNIILNPMYMPSREWNQRFINVASWNADPDMLWQGRFGNKSMYMYKPLCCAFQMIEYPSPWGLSYPGVTYNLRHETLMAGRAEDMGFFPGLGTNTYANARASNTPAKFVPYGLFCINAYKQQHHSTEHFEITAEVYKLPVYHNAIHREANRLVPEWDDDLFMIEIGSMPSYDWETHHQLVPCIMYTDAPQFVNNCSRHAITETDLSYGGLESDQAAVLANAGINVNANFNDYFGLDIAESSVRGREVSTGMLAPSVGNTGAQHMNVKDVLDHIPPGATHTPKAATPMVAALPPLVSLPTNAPTSAIPGGNDPASQILPPSTIQAPIPQPEQIKVVLDEPAHLPVTQGGSTKN